MAEPFRTPTPSNQKAWENNPPGPMREQLSAREVTDVFRTIAAHGGGPASSDLALDLVLNQVVEQVRLATGATGAAIALARAGEMVCRATSGADAPELGVRLDLASGMSGACLQTGTIQRCGDTENDPRVNAEDCRRLGLRAIVMLPLESAAAGGSERFGILQAFSSWPNAFSDRDVNTLQVLARRVIENVVENAEENRRQSDAARLAASASGVVPLAEQTVAGPAPAEVEAPQFAETHAEAPPAASGWTSVWTSILGLLVIALAVALGLAVGWRAGLGRRLSGTQPATSANRNANQGSDAAGRRGTASAATPSVVTAENDSESSVQNLGAASAVAPPNGGLLVTENGRVIYRLPASANLPGTVADAKKSDASARRLIHRVEPEYPTEASAKNIQGVVTLEVQIGTDGTVHNITVIDGEAQLAEAAVQAVRQWRYRPYLVNGRPVEMETRVTIRFTRPAG